MEIMPRQAFCLLSVILISSRAIHCAQCLPGWLKWQQSCYILLPDKMDWFEASEACNRPGSGLVVPNSREENDFVWKSVGPQTDGMWIGCTDAAQEGIWLCGGQPVTFSSWYWGNPHNDSHCNCARMTVYGAGVSWADDVPCGGSNNRKHAACEMTVSAVPAYHTITGPDGRIPQQCLLHHDIKNLKVDGVLACGWACLADPRCRSFNLWQSIKREKMCQLNDVTRQAADGNDFKATDNCYYFDL
ncbi:CD209 antigen-like [Patiria miniata]|uniref:C-type lectin domain-containing protein n=1 Tax=Patiria miniata TaxID=46514 RepID=A0A914B0T3_PATMI|nr:CD209 antigen-like [Patiria miniata]